MTVGHRLFFAIRPPADLIPRIAALRDRAGTGHGRVEDHRLHVTTWLFPDHAALPPGLVERAGLALEALDARAFSVRFDRMSGDDRGIRLIPSAPSEGYAAFQHGLAAALARAELAPRPDWRFSPHLTLRYGGRQRIDEAVPEIGWRVAELVLIDSVLGANRHETLARWPLR